MSRRSASRAASTIHCRFTFQCFSIPIRFLNRLVPLPILDYQRFWGELAGAESCRVGVEPWESALVDKLTGAESCRVGVGQWESALVDKPSQFLYSPHVFASKLNEDNLKDLFQPRQLDYLYTIAIDKSKKVPKLSLGASIGVSI
jgi:hypothetical protein